MNTGTAPGASRIASIILAAGRSSRMGAMKLLLPLGGRPVIAHVAVAALAAPLRPVVVVLGYQADQVRAALTANDLVIVENTAYAEGQSTSLHAALHALPPTATGVIVLLGDQPFITAQHISSLAAAVQATGAPVVAASYSGQRGNPVYFARDCFPELLAVTGDQGGRAVIARHQRELVLVELDDADLALDLDDAAAYGRVRAAWARRHPGEA